MAQNVLWFSLQLPMTWSILWALPQYRFLSGILPWIQQPKTARIQGIYCLYPALVGVPYLWGMSLVLMYFLLIQKQCI